MLLGSISLKDTQPLCHSQYSDSQEEMSNWPSWVMRLPWGWGKPEHLN